MVFKKNCERCQKKFQPNTPAHKLCYDCMDKAQFKNKKR